MSLKAQITEDMKTAMRAKDSVRLGTIRLLQAAMTQKEVDDTKTYMTGSYPLRFDGNKRIASILVGMQMLGLPVTYRATRNAKVEAVTLADVNRVAASLLTPDNLTFVVVGEAKGVASSN